MSFDFRPARRLNTSLILGLSGGTGSGKTFSAFRLAKGLAGDKRFAVIDTEAGRASHYADQFAFDVGELRPPFRPDAYAEAIAAADTAGYPVIVADSMSHEWAGDGGILDWQEEELDRMAGTDYGKREACKMAAWIKPKMSHKQFVQRLLQVRAHLILCFRAEPKIDMVRENGRTVIKPKASLTGLDGWIPICEKSLPYELTASFLLMAERPGVPMPIKLQEQHKACVALDRPLTEQTGAALAAWHAVASQRRQLLRLHTTPASARALISPALSRSRSRSPQTNASPRAKKRRSGRSIGAAVTPSLRPLLFQNLPSRQRQPSPMPNLTRRLRPAMPREKGCSRELRSVPRAQGPSCDVWRIRADVHAALAVRLPGAPDRVGLSHRASGHLRGLRNGQDADAASVGAECR
jgi:hypothetical protein